MYETLDCGRFLRIDEVVVGGGFELTVEGGCDANGEARVRFESSTQPRSLFVHKDLDLPAVFLTRLLGDALGPPLRSFFCGLTVAMMRLLMITFELADADGCLCGPIMGRGAHDEAFPAGRVHLLAAKADNAGMAPEMPAEKGVRRADWLECNLVWGK